MSDFATLIAAARTVRRAAYAPYSRFQVGAALLGSDGRIFTGCNVENASYGLTQCAERNAIAAAIAGGCRQFTTLALSLSGGGTPCGACRQVLFEFAPDLELMIDNCEDPDDPEAESVVEGFMLRDLLPEPFDFKAPEDNVQE